MAKSVYIETSVPSAYVSERTDAASVHWRAVTRRWWHEQAPGYRLVTSEATIAELLAGSYPGKAQAVALLDGLPLLRTTDEALSLAEVYVRHRLMPASVAGDALHFALASLGDIDYLLTWNLRHLANPNKAEHMVVINRRLGLLPPVVCSPEALWLEEEI